MQSSVGGGGVEGGEAERLPKRRKTEADTLTAAASTTAAGPVLHHGSSSSSMGASSARMASGPNRTEMPTDGAGSTVEAAAAVIHTRLPTASWLAVQQQHSRSEQQQQAPSLSSLVSLLAQQGCFHPVVRALQLFAPTSPLVHLLLALQVREWEAGRAGGSVGGSFHLGRLQVGFALPREGGCHGMSRCV